MRCTHVDLFMRATHAVDLIETLARSTLIEYACVAWSYAHTAQLIDAQ